MLYSDSFANFGAVFDSAPNTMVAPKAPTPSQDALLLDDLLSPATVGPSSLPFNAFSPTGIPQGNQPMNSHIRYETLSVQSGKDG